MMAAALLVPAFLLSGGALAAPLTWEKLNDAGFGIAVPTDNRSTFSMAGYNGSLYAGTLNNSTGCQVWRYDGTDWDQRNINGFGDLDDALAIHSMTVFDGYLWAGTGYGYPIIEGCGVWRTYIAPTWYLAEEVTAGDFETYVLVQNPNAAPVSVDLDFMTSIGPIAGPRGAVIPANSRATFKANEYVTDFNVSTKVTSTGGAVICERAMYDTARTWAHDSVGYTP